MEEANSMVKAITDDAPEEIAGFCKAEANKVSSKLKPLEGKFTRASGTAAKVKTDAEKKNGVELEQLKVQALQMVRYHQQEKKVKTADVYTQFDKKKDGKIDEAEFTAFFKGCAKD
jgi:hypothetical protein